MTDKECFKCKEIKPYSEYYKHPQMADGYLNKCKPCAKSDAIANRHDKIEIYRAYDRKRGNRQTKEYQDKYKNDFYNKDKAHNAVSNAIRDKKLFKEPCEVCGTEKDVHAHHDDYLKKLNVRWLCPIHHKEWHMKNGEGKNGRNETL